MATFMDKLTKLYGKGGATPAPAPVAPAPPPAPVVTPTMSAKAQAIAYGSGTPPLPKTQEPGQIGAPKAGQINKGTVGGVSQTTGWGRNA